MTPQEKSGKSPKTVIAEKAFCSWDYPIFMIVTAIALWAILDFVYYWFSYEDWRYYPVSYAALTGILIVTLTNNLGRWFILPMMKRPKFMAPDNTTTVAVVTTFVPSGEPIDMLEHSLTAMVAIDYPHDTWVLDEGDDDDVKRLCERLGVRHFSRKNLPKYQTETGIYRARTKYGNYNAWLSEIGYQNYEIITAFDPDHVPHSDFLHRTIGYFDDPKIGYVQAAPAYYNQTASLVAHGAAEDTYAYHSSIQMAAFSMGFPVIIGSHNTHRSSALKQVGGFADHDADDLLVTARYRDHNWQGVYVPEILAKGLTPESWNDYFVQQHRWTRSVLDLKYRSYPEKNKNIPLATRVMKSLHGLNYLHKSVILLLGLIVLIYSLFTGYTPNVVSVEILPRIAVLLVPLLLVELYRQRFYLDWKNEMGIHWRVWLLQYAKWPCSVLAIFDVILDRKKEYTLTNKTNSEWHFSKYMWPHVLVIVLIVVAWGVGSISGRITNPILHLCATVTFATTLLIVLLELVNHPNLSKKSSHEKICYNFVPKDRKQSLL